MSERGITGTLRRSGCQLRVKFATQAALSQPPEAYRRFWNEPPNNGTRRRLLSQSENSPRSAPLRDIPGPHLPTSSARHTGRATLLLSRRRTRGSPGTSPSQCLRIGRAKLLRSRRFGSRLALPTSSARRSGRVKLPLSRRRLRGLAPGLPFPMLRKGIEVDLSRQFTTRASQNAAPGHPPAPGTLKVKCVSSLQVRLPTMGAP